MIAPRALVFRPLVKGNEDSGNEIGSQVQAARGNENMFVRARALDCVYVIVVTASTVTERYHENSCFYRCMDIVLF